MLNEKLLNIFTGALLFLIMSVVCWQLSEGGRPDQIYSKAPVYTNQSYLDLEKENVHLKIRWMDADQVLEDIIKAYGGSK